MLHAGRRDLLGDLPPEIAAEILLYLDIRLHFKARRVSRGWSVLFSDPHNVKASIDPWYTKDDLPDNAKAEQVNAYRIGSPFSRTLIDAVPVSSAYANGTLAWIDIKDLTVVNVQKLGNHARTTLHSPNRAILKHIALSPSMIVAAEESITGILVSVETCVITHNCNDNLPELTIIDPAFRATQLDIRTEGGFGQNHVMLNSSGRSILLFEYDYTSNYVLLGNIQANGSRSFSGDT